MWSVPIGAGCPAVAADGLGRPSMTRRVSAVVAVTPAIPALCWPAAGAAVLLDDAADQRLVGAEAVQRRGVEMGPRLVERTPQQPFALGRRSRRYRRRAEVHYAAQGRQELTR